jgi:hypothetical protein
MRNILLTLIIVISASFCTNAQTEYDTNSKELKKYNRTELRNAKRAFSKQSEYELILTRNVEIDTLQSTYKSDVVLTLCPTDFYCNKLFKKGKLTGEMFYEKWKINPNSDSRVLINKIDGDTIKTKLWNNGKGSLSILNFKHLPKLDTKTERKFVIWATSEKLFGGGHSVFFLSLKNDNAKKKTNLNDFIKNSSGFKLIYSHNEI